MTDTSQEPQIPTELVALEEAVSAARDAQEDSWRRAPGEKCNDTREAEAVQGAEAALQEYLASDSGRDFLSRRRAWLAEQRERHRDAEVAF